MTVPTNPMRTLPRALKQPLDSGISHSLDCRSMLRLGDLALVTLGIFGTLTALNDVHASGMAVPVKDDQLSAKSQTVRIAEVVSIGEVSVNPEISPFRNNIFNGFDRDVVQPSGGEFVTGFPHYDRARWQIASRVGVIRPLGERWRDKHFSGQLSEESWRPTVVFDADSDAWKLEVRRKIRDSRFLKFQVIDIDMREIDADGSSGSQFSGIGCNARRLGETHCENAKYCSEYGDYCGAKSGDSNVLGNYISVKASSVDRKLADENGDRLLKGIIGCANFAFAYAGLK